MSALLSRNLSGLVVVGLLLASCQTAPAPGAGNEAGNAASDPAVAASTDGKSEGVTKEAVEAVDRMTPQERQLSAEEQEQQKVFRQIWQEPSFQRALAESWLRGSEVEPQLTQREAQFRLEVLELINKNQLEAAESRLKDLQGDNAVFDYMLGNLYFGQQKFPEAVLEYSKAVSQMSNFRRAWQNLAFAQIRNAKYDAARDALVRVISLGGSNAQTYGMLGMMHAQTGDYVAAESALRMVMMMQPDEQRWRMMLGQAMFQQGKYGDTASLAGVLLEKEPNRADLWLMQANAYVGMNETQKASENLEIVHQLGGSTYESLSLLGNIYFNDEAYALSVDAYLRAIELGKDKDHRPVLEVATRLAARSAYRESQQLVQGIERVYGESLDKVARIDLLKLQARLAVASGATEEQIALLIKVVDEDPLDGDALLQLGRHYQLKGDAEKAILRYQQAAQNEKFGAEARVLHAQLLVAEGRNGEALPLLRAAQAIKQRDDVQKLIEYVERAISRGNG